jgi:predicted amidohydrolase
LANQAGERGAEWILLPEFFTTGMGWGSQLEDTALPPDGPATEMLLRVASRHGAKVGGSFLCRDDDGHVRNAFFLATPDGIAGRHDKDVPTQWENFWYVGGSDDGVMEVDGLKVGAALCLELGRTQTVRRLRGVDLVVGGSFTWHYPSYWPRALGRARLEQKYGERYPQWAAPFARLVGAPVVEATHCGELDTVDPLLRIPYRSRIGSGAKICAADGTVIAERSHLDGPGVVVAEVEVGSVPPLDEPPDRTYLVPRGLIWTTVWALQRAQGRRAYRRSRGRHR